MVQELARTPEDRQRLEKAGLRMDQYDAEQIKRQEQAPGQSAQGERDALADGPPDAQDPPTFLPFNAVDDAQTPTGIFWGYV